ncbi:hypothetical protein P7K49_002021 [Saguinus oedipus]|uniref:Basic proline-rich protein-like n=1 Tax=Saguinus oedipus TaxID=9490 RepID=A0ABQ9WG55_SAGOE|nr:hypothetical protein P7K49_002021 [Saguinus oedipus]
MVGAAALSLILGSPSWVPNGSRRRSEPGARGGHRHRHPQARAGRNRILPEQRALRSDRETEASEVTQTSCPGLRGSLVAEATSAGPAPRADPAAPPTPGSPGGVGCSPAPTRGGGSQGLRDYRRAASWRGLRRGLRAGGRGPRGNTRHFINLSAPKRICAPSSGLPLQPALHPAAAPLPKSRLRPGPGAAFSRRPPVAPEESLGSSPQGPSLAAGPPAGVFALGAPPPAAAPNLALSSRRAFAFTRTGLRLRTPPPRPTPSASTLGACPLGPGRLHPPWPSGPFSPARATLVTGLSASQGGPVPSRHRGAARTWGPKATCHREGGGR